MTLNSLTLVGIRLIAVNLMVNGGMQAILIMGMRGMFAAGAATYFWLSIAASLLSGIFLWAFSEPIARIVSKDGAHEITFGAMSLADCYTFGFAAIGLYYISWSMPSAVRWIFYIFKTTISTPGAEWRQKVEGQGIFEMFGWVVAGYFLLIKSRAWALALARRQGAAVKDEPMDRGDDSSLQSNGADQ